MFTGILNVTADQASQPLTLKLSNGSYSGRQFAWVRVFLNHGRIDQPPAQPVGRLIADERALARSNPLVLDMTNQLTAGANTLVVQGAGLPGAALNYELTSAPPPPPGAAKAAPLKVQSIEPPEVPPGGTITLRGTGFDEAGNNTKVVMYTRPATVVRGSATEIVVKVPDGLPPHAYNVELTVRGVKANMLQVDVSGPPELNSCSMSGLQPGANIDLYGNNFSKIASKNVVTLTIPSFDNAKHTANVISSTKQSLTFTVPSFPELEQRLNGGVATPANLTLSVNGVQASATLTVFISIRPMAN
jgi:hypothetical protein